MDRYGSYKDSGIESLGIVPESWKTSRFKYHHIELDNTVGEDSNSYPLLSLTKGGVIFRDVESGKGKYPESFENYKVVEKDNLIFCLYDIEETPRTVGISENDGMITGSYKIFKTKNSVIPKFTYYTYLVIDDVKGLKPYYTGLRNVVRPETFKNLPLNVPPLHEQQQIVSFLDTKTSLIDSLIERTQRKIELLKEQRTSLINEVVTKGLNPNVEMKDSGVEWIGEIPSHWEIIKCKYILDILTGNYPDEIIESETGVDFVKVDDLNNVNGQILESSNLKIETKDLTPLPEGIILFPKRGMTIFTNKVVITLNQTFIDPNLMGVKVFDNYSTHLLYYQIKNRGLGDICDSSTIPQINNKHIYPLQFSNPPLNEQHQMVEYLDNETHLIDKTISNEEKRIELLKEYRQSLISEVVTGKIKVSEV